MLHKQVKDYLLIQKMQKYLRAKSDLCKTMTGVNVPNQVTLRSKSGIAESVDVRKRTMGLELKTLWRHH